MTETIRGLTPKEKSDIASKHIITQVTYLMSIRQFSGTPTGAELQAWANIINSALELLTS